MDRDFTPDRVRGQPRVALDKPEGRAGALVPALEVRVSPRRARAFRFGRGRRLRRCRRLARNRDEMTHAATVTATIIFVEPIPPLIPVLLPLDRYAAWNVNFVPV